VLDHLSDSSKTVGMMGSLSAVEVGPSSPPGSLSTLQRRGDGPGTLEACWAAVSAVGVSISFRPCRRRSLSGLGRRRLNDRSGNPAVSDIVGSGLDLSIVSEQVDVSFSSNVLEHVPDPEGTLIEMVRVTRAGACCSARSLTGCPHGEATKLRRGTISVANEQRGYTNDAMASR
jgi:SAM-dependent methyltransferase